MLNHNQDTRKILINLFTHVKNLDLRELKPEASTLTSFIQESPLAKQHIHAIYGYLNQIKISEHQAAELQSCLTTLKACTGHQAMSRDGVTSSPKQHLFNAAKKHVQVLDMDTEKLLLDLYKVGNLHTELRDTEEKRLEKEIEFLLFFHAVQHPILKDKFVSYIIKRWKEAFSACQLVWHSNDLWVERILHVLEREKGMCDEVTVFDRLRSLLQEELKLSDKDMQSVRRALQGTSIDIGQLEDQSSDLKKSLREMPSLMQFQDRVQAISRRFNRQQEASHSIAGRQEAHQDNPLKDFFGQNPDDHPEFTPPGSPRRIK